MGFLRSSGALGVLEGFDKAVFSLWFRAPDATLTAARTSHPIYPSELPEDAASDHMTSLVYYPPFVHILPLVTFGGIQFNTDGKPCQPSFIGIDCWEGMNRMVCNLQSSSEIGFVMEFPEKAGDIFRPACFFMGIGGGSVGSPFNVNVSADQWHHILFSFDISGSMTCDLSLPGTEDSLVYTSSSLFSWAFDDVSRVDRSIFESGGALKQGLEGNARLIVPQLQDYPADEGDHIFCGPCIIEPGMVGVPNYTSFEDYVFKVEMAHLQIYTGVYRDCAELDVRRAFVTNDGRPASPSLASGMLGRPPKIWFRTQQDWITGNNRGTGGSFTKTGTVNAYSGSVSL